MNFPRGRYVYRSPNLVDYLSGRRKFKNIVLLKKNPRVGQTIRFIINHQNW